MAVHVRGQEPRKWRLREPQLRKRDSGVYSRRFKPGSTPPPMLHPAAIVALDLLREDALPPGITRLVRRERVSSFNRPTEHAEPEPLDLTPELI